MSPQNVTEPELSKEEIQDEDSSYGKQTEKTMRMAPPPTNAQLVPDAGKVHMDEAQMWGTGIIADIKRTVGTHWVEEVTNFNQKTVAVTLLIFISVIAPTLTFGAVYGKETDNKIGAVETILATSWVGVVYALIGGMPLVSIETSFGEISVKLTTYLTTYAYTCFVPTTVHYWIDWTSDCLHQGRCPHCRKH